MLKFHISALIIVNNKLACIFYPEVVSKCINNNRKKLLAEGKFFWYLACHVLVDDNMQSVYTLRNYGRNANCSLTALFPVRVSLLSLSVGITMTGSNFKVETGTMKKCQETGHKDYLEISGGIDFAVPKVLTGANLCGLDSYPGQISETVLCGVSSVTLYSSGEYDNSATVAVRQATEEDILSPAALLCP